jgi:hypothetical protein
MKLQKKYLLTPAVLAVPGLITIASACWLDSGGTMVNGTGFGAETDEMSEDVFTRAWYINSETVRFLGAGNIYIECGDSEMVEIDSVAPHWTTSLSKSKWWAPRHGYTWVESYVGGTGELGTNRARAYWSTL